ncbi:hypothetical protein [Caminibacter pacificus]|nr:hypothetical protein [Caminibacter pacificus]
MFYLTEFYQKYRKDKNILLTALYALGDKFEKIANQIKENLQEKNNFNAPSL